MKEPAVFCGRFFFLFYFYANLDEEVSVYDLKNQGKGEMVC